MKLIIAEKPGVAKSIASALSAKSGAEGCFEGCGAPVAISEYQRHSETPTDPAGETGLIVSWCVGHLVSPMDAAGYDERFKKWRYDDLPILPEPFRYVLAPGKEDAFDNPRRLMARPDVDTVVNTCNAGREGELIFRLVYEMAGCKKPIVRLWISSMEDTAIREGVDELRPGAEYENLYQSALCRQKADWIVGINASRLFSVLYHRTLNVGRVQTPTLAMLVERNGKIDGEKDAGAVRASCSLHLHQERGKEGAPPRSCMTSPPCGRKRTAFSGTRRNRRWTTPRAFMNRSY